MINYLTAEEFLRCSCSRCSCSCPLITLFQQQPVCSLSGVNLSSDFKQGTQTLQRSHLNLELNPHSLSVPKSTFPNPHLHFWASPWSVHWRLWPSIGSGAVKPWVLGLAVLSTWYSLASFKPEFHHLQEHFHESQLLSHDPIVLPL